MVLELAPIPLPLSANIAKLANFGREVKGVDVTDLSTEEFKEIEDALYKHDILLFRDVTLTVEQQYAFTKAFDPECEIYSHGNSRTEATKKSILSYLTTIPRVPQVQLIGNGTIRNHEGLSEVVLKHPTHKSSHITHISKEDEAKGFTRFVRWHMDAALYDLNPPKVTTLYAITVPQGPEQICRYDDGTGEELPVPLAATAFASGKIMFDILPPDLKSLVVRTRVKYAPHPYVWMSKAHLLPTGLGIENEGLEMGLDSLPPWEEGKIMTYPAVWKNPVTAELYVQIHPCCVFELLIDPVSAGAQQNGALYPEGANLTDLKEIRDILYKIQRPAISPGLVYPHDWQTKDLVVFHNRGVLHSVTGTLADDKIRKYHQCNVSSAEEPVGPGEADIKRWA